MQRIHRQRVLLLDCIFLTMVPFVSLLLIRGFAGISYDHTLPILILTPVGMVLKLIVLHAYRLYHRHWRYASVEEVVAILKAVVLAGILNFCAIMGFRCLYPELSKHVPDTLFLADGLITLLVVSVARFSSRLMPALTRGDEQTEHRRRVLVMGAGYVGAMIVREIRSARSGHVDVVGFVDDDPVKQGMTIHGVPVLGTSADIPSLAADIDIDEVILALPMVSGKTIRDIVHLCEAGGVAFRTVPAIHEIIAGQVSVSEVRDLRIEDLLRREPVETDFESVEKILTGRCVLVTGAGGSIGSELCRQIAAGKPKELLLLGHGENSIFVFADELRKKWPDLGVREFIADIRDEDRLNSIFNAVTPDIVFHAAAHKHVALMEGNVADAVTNNIVGSQFLVALAEQYGVQRLVSISSDKAVNPTSVMGVTKRVSELVVQEAGIRTGRSYVSVRFGNVLGSRGSVVPLFQEQIARGGPITITHPDVERYFMTIPEAAKLVLQAATMGRSGDIFVLDMGDPIKIVDLATDLAELMGFRLGHDIDIEVTGLKPGEKMAESLLNDKEEQFMTSHPKIFRTTGLLDSGGSATLTGMPDHLVGLRSRIEELVDSAREGRPDRVREILSNIVPEATLM